MYKTLISLTAIIVLAIAPARALTNVSDDSKRIYCNGNSFQIIEQYEKEMLSGKAQPVLILADIYHILQIAGYDKTLALLKELSRSTTTDAEILYVQDIVQLYEELNIINTTQGNTRWDIYDNIKEKMPNSILALQGKFCTLLLSGKNKFRVAQYQNGFIPVQRFTQDDNTFGLCSGSFQANVPITLRIYSNMDYVFYINGKKICINALTYKKKLVRMFRIESYGGFTVALYYKPVDDMFLKIQFYDDANQIVHLADSEISYFHDVQWYETNYTYEYQLLSQYNKQRSAETALQIALFYESLQSSEAFKYYQRAIQSHNEFIVCRFLSLLLKNENRLLDSKLIMQGILKESERITSVLWQYYYDYIYKKKSIELTQVYYLPLLIHLLHREEDELINKKLNLEPLLERYPFSNDLRYALAKITSHYDIKKAINLLESIPKQNDKEMALLLQCYEQDEQFEPIVSILEHHTAYKYFDDYIHALIALKRYNEAKSALFKRIVQGFDSQAYALLATISDLEGSDGSMYRQKHEVIVSGIPHHSDYMKVAFYDYVHKTVFSRLAFETIHAITHGLLYSCYALRIINNNIYCTIYDIYNTHSVSLINDYAFGKDVTITECTIYLVDENGKIKKNKIKYMHNSFKKDIKDYFSENLSSIALLELSFRVHKNIPLLHIQQNYDLSQFDMDIIVMDPQTEPHIVSSLQGNFSKGKQGIQHIRFNAYELSEQNNRNFIVMSLTPESLIEWIDEQNVRFKIADYFAPDTKLTGKTVEESASELVSKLKQFTIINNPYITTSFVQFTSSCKGSLLDAILYARYMLAKNGIMSYIAFGSIPKSINKQYINNGLYFDTVLLYIPLTSEKGIWLTCEGTYPTVDEIGINNIMLIVGDEVIQKSSGK